MKTTTLVENTSVSSKYKNKHGLSFYIETQKYKILFDLGSSKLFLENVKRLGIDIGAIDIVIISHGHKDHGGALDLFLENNKTSKVYIQRTAFQSLHTKVLGVPIYIGLDNKLKNHEQVVLVDKKLIIDDELQLFSDVKKTAHYSIANDGLYIKTEEGFLKDEFMHEQNLIVTEGGKNTLFGGCAHNGIINIQNRAESILKKELSYVISGFHLYNPISRKRESEKSILELGNFLRNHDTKYYTCHCTGKKAFDILKSSMGKQIMYLSAGSSIEV